MPLSRAFFHISLYPVKRRASFLAHRSQPVLHYVQELSVNQPTLRRPQEPEPVYIYIYIYTPEGNVTSKKAQMGKNLQT
jgi:hypothetical protein